ncbi:uncharacterized protein A4U43_C06F13260, partial [Asparagus officinalis]
QKERLMMDKVLLLRSEFKRRIGFGPGTMNQSIKQLRDVDVLHFWSRPGWRLVASMT